MRAEKTIRNSLSFDHDTWARAKGWGLCKALYELSTQKDTSSIKAIEQRQIIDNILNESES